MGEQSDGGFICPVHVIKADNYRPICAQLLKQCADREVEAMAPRVWADHVALQPTRQGWEDRRQFGRSSAAQIVQPL
jgi:hypothetical protein